MPALRKSNPDPAQPDETLNHAALQADGGVLTEVSRQSLHTAEIYKLVGRIEAAHFYETVSAKMLAETYQKARFLIGEAGEITVRLRDGSSKRVSGMDEFCDAVMPVSARRCQQIISALNTLGNDLYEQAERIGFRARDYQALKALPTDDQALVKRALETGDREEVVDLLSELAARNQALRNQKTEADKALAAKDKVIQSKSAKLDKMAEDEAARRNATMEEAEAFQLRDLRSVTLEVELTLLRMLATVDEVMNQAATPAAETAARHSLDYVVQRIVDGCNARSITVDLVDRVTPIWAAPLEAVAAAGAARTPRRGA